MSIGINGGSPFGGVQTSGPVLGAGLRQDKDGDNDASSRVSGPSRGGLLQNVVQSLGQLGLSSPSQVISPASGQDPNQAMHSFMHSLYRALQQEGGQTANGGNANNLQTKPAGNNASQKNALAAYGANGATASTVQSRYNSIEDNLNNLLNDVASNSSNPAVADLSSKFANLVQTLKSGQTTATTQPQQTTPQQTLQNFLQDMIQNNSNPLNATGLGSSGNLLSIRV